jgi:hypothetical protein
MWVHALDRVLFECIARLMPWPCGFFSILFGPVSLYTITFKVTFTTKPATVPYFEVIKLCLVVGLNVWIVTGECNHA